MERNSMTRNIGVLLGGGFLVGIPMLAYWWEVSLGIATFMWMAVFVAIFWFYLRPLFLVTRPGGL